MYEGFEPVVVDVLGGLCTRIERSDLPIGVSPRAENVRFFPGGVRSRGGFDILFGDSGDPSAGYWGGFGWVSYNGERYYSVLMGQTGAIRSWYPSSLSSSPTVTNIERIGKPAYSTVRSTSLYGRNYVCVGDGKRGIIPPFQFDGRTDPWYIGSSGGHEAQITRNVGGGNMVAGRYFIAVAFENISGFISPAVKLNYETLSNGDDFSLTSIPIGPPGTIKRRIFVSLPDTFDLYNPAALVINDNTSTSGGPYDLSVDEIAAGLPYQTVALLQQPAPHLGVVDYNNRLVLWGGNNRIFSFFGPTTTGINPSYSSIGLINLDFSSDAASAYTWNVAGEYGEWYGSTTAATVMAGTKGDGELANYLRITSTGGVADGDLNQGYGIYYATLRPNRDAIGNQYLVPGRKYGIRVRARRSNGAVAGNLNVTLYTNPNLSSRTTVTAASFPVSSMTTEWAIYEYSGTTAVNNDACVSMNVKLTSVTANETIDISHIEVFDTADTRTASSLYISRADDPESFDELLGKIIVNDRDGEDIRNVFVLHGNLYVCKENSLYVIQDNGQEPATWSTEKVSGVVGTTSVHGVGIGDNFALIVSRDGLYMMTGGMPENVSKEIEPTWALFDWTKGEQMYCAVDSAKRYAVVGGPTTGGGSQQLYVDFSLGWGDPMGGGEAVRKWGIDKRAVNGVEYGFSSAFTTVMPDESSAIVYTAANPQALLMFEDSSRPFDMTAILSVERQHIDVAYETAPIGSDIGRSLFGGVVLKIRGSGTLLSSFVRPSGTSVSLPSRSLTDASNHDVEIRTMNSDTQLGYLMSLNNETNAYFIAKRIAVLIKKHPSARFRGY
jgi:hypothetical protein